MIYLGSSYYLPHHEPADWERDFAQMVAHGHNTVRTGELLASWDLLETVPGQPDLTSLDQAFALASRHGIKILLGTGACSPPRWLLAEYPDLSIVDRDGHSYPPGAMWSWACINHPAYLAASDRYLHQLLERYGAHPQLLGWQIHNEPGYPFIPRDDRLRPEWFDYNPHTVTAFRVWLRQRYASIENLNAAWLWVPTNVRYRDFDEVQPPRRTASEWGIPKAWLDWRCFTYANWNDLIHRQHEIIKNHSPAIVTMTNVLGAAFDTDGRLGTDSWTLPRNCDVIGYDMYPGTHMPTATAVGRPAAPRRNFAAWFLDFAYSTAKHNNKPLWLPEMEAGPLAGWAKGPQYATDAADLRRWGLMSLARGVGMLLYQGYRQWPSLPMNWGGLAGWEGETTARLVATRQLADLIDQHGTTLTAARSRPAKIALLHSQENVVFCAASATQELANRALHDMHDTLGRLGHAVEFVDPDHLTQAMDYALVILPFTVLLDATSARALADYVYHGGCLVSMPRTAMVDGGCHVWAQRPGGGLAEVLGISEEKIVVADNIEVQVAVSGEERMVIAGFHHRQYVRCASDVKVIGTFADGGAAVTMRKHGAGLALHCATHLDINASSDESHLLWWRSLLDKCSIVPEARKLGPGADLVEVRLRDGPNNTSLLFAANENDTAVQVEIILSDMAISTVTNLWCIGKVHLEQEPNQEQKIIVSLPAREALVASVNMTNSSTVSS